MNKARVVFYLSSFEKIIFVVFVNVCMQYLYDHKYQPTYV